MNKEHQHLITNMEHEFKWSSLFWRGLPFGRWSISLLIVFTFAGCAGIKPGSPLNAVQGFSRIPPCPASDNAGRGAIYFFDRNDVLYTVTPQDPPIPNSNWYNHNPGSDIISKDASTLIKLNEQLDFHKPPHDFHRHVSNWYAGTAVFALIDDPNAECPTYKCVYKAKSTEWLNRDVVDYGYKECGEKSCPHGGYPCGAKICCYP
jgi:hypothetical protein